MSAIRTRDQVRFDALRNALYHGAMRRRYTAMNRWGNFLTVMLGTATVVEFSQWFKGLDLTKVLGAMTALIGTSQLVFGFSEAAQKHEGLQRRFYDLFAEIERNPTEEPAKVAEWNATLVIITADEPPTNHLVDARAYNEACNALGWDETECLVIPRWIAFKGIFLPLNGYRFEKIKERRDREQPRLEPQDA